MPRLSLYYRYRDHPRRLVRVADDPPAELLMAIWANTDCRADGVDYELTFRSEDAVSDYHRYNWYQRVVFDEVPAPPSFLNPTGFSPGVPVTHLDDAILLLLESPHADETNGGLQPRFPAAGQTGRQIDGQLAALNWVMNDAAQQGRIALRQGVAMPFIICNPIPHPTSTRVSLNDKRGWPWWKEFVFEALWRDAPKVRGWFQYRLRRHQPRIILNACTRRHQPTGRTPDIRRQPDGSYRFPAHPPRNQRIGLPAAPDALVQAAIERYLHRCRRTYSHLAYNWVDGGFQLKAAVSLHRMPDVLWIDLPHPAGWIG